MTISKSEIKISTANAVIGLILGIGSVFFVFYNAKAQESDKTDAVSQRVTKLEAIVPLIQSDVKDIKTATNDVPNLVRMIKRAYPNY